MSQHRPPPAVFDFSVFLDAPGIAAQVKQYGAPQIVDIPQTLIPSPLAPDLAPNTVEKLRDFLIGDGSSPGHGKGAEVWTSWKRAWDLWNNHYIEGRVSPVWIREEYERIKKEMEEARDIRRRDEQMRRIRSRHRPGRSIATGPATIFSTTQPKAEPGKVYKQTAETRPSGVVVVQKMESRPKPGSTRVHKRKGEVVEVYGERFITEIVQVERVVPKQKTTSRSWTSATTNNTPGVHLIGSKAPESTETVIEYTLEERQVMKFGHVDIVGDQVAPKLMSYEEVNKYVEANGTFPGAVISNPPVIISQRPEMWYPVTEPCLDGTRILTVDETVPVIEFEDKMVETLEEGEGVLLGWAEEDIPDVNMDMGEDFWEGFGELPVVDEEPAIFYQRADKVEREDGFGGGFFPMKILDPYPEPDETAEEELEFRWLDAIQNTVWRPCRVGEKTLRIEMDEPFEVVAAENGLEFDGGVDCGRSPYPVLRSVTEHFKISQQSRNLPAVFRKKKMWDKVTGTIFNMPNKPLEEDASEDDRVDRMSVLYGDFFRDEAGKHRHDCFPLNIRRVKRRADNNYPARQNATPVSEANETLVRYPWHIPEGKENDISAFEDKLSAYDPWKVTAEQRQKREVPVRRYPPAQSDKGEGHVDLLPVDDSLWREALEDDDYGRWKYYVTNLHGGTLLINGKEIKINQIAGPLPEFAIIETPGGQISFWWGPSGRNHLAGNPSLSHESAWRSLRSRDDEFKTVALTAGQEWDYKIRERITKEFSGNEWEDDKDWEQWKKAVAAPEVDQNSASEQPDDSTLLPLDVLGERRAESWTAVNTAIITFEKYTKSGVPTGKDVVQPEIFPTDTDELMWLHTKAEPLSRAIEAAKTNNFIEPLDIATGFFPGANRPSVRPEVVAQRQAIGVWTAQLPEIARKQQMLINYLTQAKVQRAEREKQANMLIGKKRAADSELQGHPSKRTMADLVRERQEAESHVQKLKDIQARKQSGSVPQSMSLAVQLFDAAIRVNLEQAIAAYLSREAAAGAAGRSFTETAPTLRHEIEQYRNAMRAREQSVALKLRQRAAKGRLPIQGVDMPPGIDLVYTLWNATQSASTEGNVKAAEDIRREGSALARFNEDSEARRLRELNDRQIEAAKKLAVENQKADEAFAANAKLTFADKAIKDRNLIRKQRELERRQAELSAAVSATPKLQQSQLQHFAPTTSQAPSTQNVRIPTIDTGGPVHSVQYIGTATPSKETLDDQQAILADINATLAKRKADLEANIIIRAEQAGQSVSKFIRDQGYVSEQDYIRLMLKNDTDTISAAPPARPGSFVLGKQPTQTLPLPSDTSDSNVLLSRLDEYRGNLRSALKRSLRNRAALEGKTQLKIVQSEGFQDIQSYLNSMSSSIVLTDVNDDVPDIQFPALLPAGANQAQIIIRRAAIKELEYSRDRALKKELAKKTAITQRLLDAENFEIAAQMLERDPPARANIRATVPKRPIVEGQEYESRVL